MFEKDLTIHKPVLPNLRMTLEFREASYGKGDKVTVDVEFKTLDDNALRYQSFEYVVNHDGEKALTKTLQTDFHGKAVIEFDLPTDLATNDGSLNVMIPYNGSTESISKAIPITLNKIDVQFMPEGGVLVANTENTIAFKAINDLGKPVDIEAEIIDKNEKRLQTIKTYHKGMGKFNLTPNEKAIKIRITKPQGIAALYDLPKANKTLSLQVINQTEKFVEVKIIGQRTAQNTVLVHSRGNIHFHETLKVEADNKLKIKTTDFPMGATLFTLMDEKIQPIAERMVFLNRHKGLDISIKTNKQKYALREKVKMDIAIKDHTGKPVDGQFSLAVVDDKLLSYADDKQANIYGDLMLTSELKGEVVEPNFYFESPKKHPYKDQALALDLLMMTQGWRSWYAKFFNNNLAISYQAERRRVSGTVTSVTEGLLNGAVVIIPELNRKTKTDEKGYFEFDDIDFKGRVTLKIKKGKIVNNYPINEYKHYQIPFNDEQIEYLTNNVRKDPGSGIGTLRGTILDRETGEPLIFSTAILRPMQDPSGFVTGVSADIDGYFSLNAEAGDYILEISYVGYQSKRYYVRIIGGTVVRVQTNMSPSSIELNEVITVVQNRPLIKLKDRGKKEQVIEIQNSSLLNNNQIQNANSNPTIRRDQTVSGKKITSKKIQQLPSEPLLRGMPPSVPGSIDDWEDATIRGSRSNSTIIYIDGIRVNGVLPPQTGPCEGMTIETSGTSANYRDNGRIDKSVDEINEEISQRQKEFHQKPQPSENKATRPAYSNYRKAVMNNRDFPERIHLLNGEQIPNEILIEVFEAIHPSVVTKFKWSSKKEYKIDGNTGAYIIETSYKNHPKHKNHKENLEDWLINSLKNYNQGVTDYNKETGYISRVVNGIEIPYTDLSNLLNSLDAEYKALATTNKKLEEMASFIGTYIKEKQTLHENPEIELYQYALNFRRGFYEPRAYYVPKYNTKQQKVKERNDFRSTIYWNPNVQLDKNGKATLEFYTADNITTYRTVIEGISTNGQLGRGEATFYAQLPFGMITKIPSIVFNGDVVNIPVTLMNNTDGVISGKLNINAPHFLELKEHFKTKVEIPANGNKTLSIPYIVNGKKQQGDLKVEFITNGIADAFTQKIAIHRIGFPKEAIYNANAGDSLISFQIDAPLDSSIVGTLNIFSSDVVEIIELSKRMIRRPTGCFEQTSSKNYPNILVYKYLKAAGKLDDKTKNTLERYMQDGYNRLSGYEVAGGGFDWYGRGPADVRLTALGLMQFTELSDIYSVSQDMLDRAAKWLLSRKNDNGSWNTSRTKNSIAHSSPALSAYTNWALTEIGYGTEITNQINASYRNALKSNNPYELALVSNILLEMNDARADTVLSRLLEAQELNGSWIGKGRSAYSSTGGSLNVETTSLSILALYKAYEKHKIDDLKMITKAIAYLKSSKKYYGFGNTQATVLALKALVRHAKTNAVKGLDGRYAVFVNDKIIMEGEYGAEASKSIKIEGLGSQMMDGENTVKVLFSKDVEPLAFDLGVSYTSSIFEDNEYCNVALTTELQETTAKLGETVRLSTIIQNKKDKTIPNPIALVGIPSGLSIQPKQLKELQEKRVFDYYELIDGFVVFHFIRMEANAEKTIHLDLKADFEGQFKAPASSAYLYYTDDKVDWNDGLEILIQ